MAPARVPLAERFWAKVDRRGEDECWPWTAYTYPRGYGRIRLPGARGGSDGAHRVAWTLTFGAIPAGLWVLHSCDNRRCCNPSHLFLGTNSDNVRDKVVKGRQCLGTRNGEAKLDDDAVRAIRLRHEQGESLQALATVFSVSKRAILFAVQRKTWRHVV